MHKLLDGWPGDQPYNVDGPSASPPFLPRIVAAQIRIVNLLKLLIDTLSSPYKRAPLRLPAWDNRYVPRFTFPITVSGPYGQYTVDAVVDPDATYSSVPSPALIEMGIEPLRLVRLKAADGQVHFRQLGRALTAVAGQEDIAPVIFGEAGEPTVLGAATLAVLMLRVDEETRRVVQDDGSLSEVVFVKDVSGA